MNNQEAIKILGQYDVSNIHFYTTDGEEIPFTEWSDAIDMAISALKAQDLQPTCNLASNDTISRKAAIEAICTEGTRLERNGTVAMAEIKQWCVDILEALPSAQPEPCGDVVSRNAIVQKLNEMDRYVSTELRLCDTDKKFPQNEVFIVDDVYEEIVEQLPSAQPDLSGYSDRLWTAAYERGKAEVEADIIHCGECKYYHDSDGCFFSTATTGADGFCHWAKRKG